MKSPTFDLAIVGAGLAGLAAARRAQELGLTTAIFEASDGVGGRVRSDNVGDYICDRGFQLINLSYPALTRFYKPDEFHYLPRGVDVVIGKKVHRLGDPREGFGAFLGSLSNSTGTLLEKLRFLRYLREISQGSSRTEVDDLSFEEEMLQEEIGSFYSKVIGPFSAGVFLNHPSAISTRVARELIHYFLIGKPGLPQGGVSKLSEALSEGLEVHLNSPVDEVGSDYLRVSRRRFKSRAIIIATDQMTASALVGDYSNRKRRLPTQMSASTTWYHSVCGEDFPVQLRIDGMGGGPVTNTIAISKLAPEYAPTGKTLISTTVMNAFGQEVSEARVRKHLTELWGRQTNSWELVGKYSIPKSLPLMFPGVVRETSIELPHGRSGIPRFLAGDFLGLPAQQGAMESGIDAAEEVFERLR